MHEYNMLHNKIGPERYERNNILAHLKELHSMKHFDDIHRYLRPSMLQHLLRRLVFDVPILNEYAKMPLKVWLLFHFIVFVLF